MLQRNSELGSYESIARNSATAHDTQPGTTPCLHMFGTHQVLVFDAQVPSQVVEANDKGLESNLRHVVPTSTH